MNRIYNSLILSLAVVLSLTSCEKNGGGGGGNMIIDGPLNSIFFGTARQCEQMLVRPLHIVQKQGTDYKGKAYTYSALALVDKPIKAEKYIHSVITGGKKLKEFYKRPQYFTLDNEYFSRANDADPAISKEENRRVINIMHEDFQNYYREKFRTVSYEWSFGTTPIVDFKIMALEPLFGQEAETSLNEHFEIVHFLPEQILSNEGKLELVRSYSKKNKKLSIKDWLNLKPTASPIMRLMFKERPNDLPETLHLVTVMKTKEGKELKDTIALQLR